MMKYNSIKEIVEGGHNHTQHQKSTHTIPSPIDCDGVQLTNTQWYLYPYYDIANAELYNLNVHLKPNRKE